MDMDMDIGYLLRALLSGQLIVLLNIRSLPGIANPDVAHSPSSQVSVIVEHIIWQ
jgi:hypothetical protein